jgi:hypothetical protein
MISLQLVGMSSQATDIIRDEVDLTPRVLPGNQAAGVSGGPRPMIGENRQLVTNEPVEFEK